MMPRGEPAITVLMPAYNAEQFIGAAIASILGQTFPDFEFLIIDDGSTDSTAAVAESVADERIKLVRNPKNLGLIATLNRGIDLARGRYIARMDADDLSLPERFAVQYRLMEASPEVVACGAWVLDFAPHRLPRYHLRECDHEDLLARMIVEPPLSHPAAFIRRSVLLAHGIRYDLRYPHCEDYRLWFDLAKVGRLTNVQKLLVRCRWSETSVSVCYAAEQGAVARGLRREIIADFLGRYHLNGGIPAQITGETLTWFETLVSGIVQGSAEQDDRRHLLAQLESIRYCLLMSVATVRFGQWLRFVGSGDWRRPVLLGLRAVRVLRKLWWPSHFAPLL